MNATEVATVCDTIKAAAVPYDWPDDFLEQVAIHLVPLDYEWVVRRVRSWAAKPNLDDRGHEHPKYANTLPEVLKACGVPLGARDDLARAASTPGALLLPDLRNVNELTYVGPFDRLPQGCFEYFAANGRAIRDREVKAIDYRDLPATEPLSLPAPPDQGMTHVEAKDFMAEVVRRSSGPNLARRAPRVTEVADLLALLNQHRDVPIVFAEAVKRLAWRFEAAVAVHEDTIAILNEQAQEQEWVFLNAADPAWGEDAADTAPPEAYLAGVKLLLTRMRAVHGGRALLSQVVDEVLRLLLPALTDVTINLERADPLDDRSPIVRLLADCRRPSAKESSPVIATQPPGPRAPPSTPRPPQRFGQGRRTMPGRP